MDEVIKRVCKGCGFPISGTYDWMASEQYVGYCLNCEDQMNDANDYVNGRPRRVDELEVEFAYFQDACASE